MTFVLLLSGVLLSPVAAAEEEETVVEMAAMVIEVSNRPPPPPGKPGAMQFPPEPIRLIETKVKRALALGSTIAANRRRPTLQTTRKIEVRLARDSIRPPFQPRGPKASPSPFPGDHTQ